MKYKNTNSSKISSKPLRKKAYGHINHLPHSRLGPMEKHCSPGEANILLNKTRDPYDHIIVTEKLDGSNVAVCRINNEIIPIIRAGYRASSSQYACHKRFAQWADENKNIFDSLLNEGEWVSGEWLALAHGTIYDLTDRPPFVAFDLFTDKKRVLYTELTSRCNKAGIETVPLLWSENKPCGLDKALTLLGAYGHYGAKETTEGAVWRCERKGEYQFVAKYVRHEKIDGKYLPDISGKPEIWLVPSTK